MRDRQLDPLVARSPAWEARRIPSVGGSPTNSRRRAHRTGRSPLDAKHRSQPAHRSRGAGHPEEQPTRSSSWWRKSGSKLKRSPRPTSKLLKDRGVRRLFRQRRHRLRVDRRGLRPTEALRTRFPRGHRLRAREPGDLDGSRGPHLGDGHPQAIMLHTSVGAPQANGICGVFNASSAQIPLLVDCRTHAAVRRDRLRFAPEPASTGPRRCLIRRAWFASSWGGDYELRGGEQVEAVVDQSNRPRDDREPRGPGLPVAPA